MACGVRYSAGFEAFPGGQRFTNEWLPDGKAPRRPVVLLPPFGEEMNKSRRSIAIAARLFASHGLAVHAFDPAGTGDSEGEFGDATWAAWTCDAKFAISRVAERWSARPTVWAIRSGALLLPALDHVFDDVLLWQPVTSGDAFLTQLLRLKVAADTFAGVEGTTTKQLRSQLGAGATLEIAGYELNPDLVLPMSAINLQTWGSPPRSTAWLETGVDPAGAHSPASQRVADAWSAHGALVVRKYVVGEQFWLTQEIAENRTIAEASVTALEGVPA
jgi:exosortase A-associated hydrolase 2